MNNIYFSSTLLWGKPFKEIFEIAKTLDCVGIEIWAQQIDYFEVSAEEIMQLKEEYGVEIFLHAMSWDLNICSINKGIREVSVNEIKKCIITAKEIRAKNVTIHPGSQSIFNKFNDLHMKLLVESLLEISTFSEELGVEISLELMESIPKQIITTPKKMNGLMRKLPIELKVTLDIAHLDSNEDFLVFIDELDNVNKAHLSGRKGSKYHVPLGQGDLNCKFMIRELSKRNLPLVIEGFDDQGVDILMNNINFIHNALQINQM